MAHCAQYLIFTYFFTVGPLCKRFDERKVLIFVGILFMFLGRIIVFPIPGFDHPPLANSTASESKTSASFKHSSANIIVVHIFMYFQICLTLWPIFSPFGYGTLCIWELLRMTIIQDLITLHYQIKLLLKVRLLVLFSLHSFANVIFV